MHAKSGPFFEFFYNTLLIKKLTKGTVTKLNVLVISSVAMAYSELLSYFFANMAIAAMEGKAQSITTVLEIFSETGTCFKINQIETGKRIILKRIKMYISKFFRYFLMSKKQKRPPIYIIDKAGAIFPSGVSAKNIILGTFKSRVTATSEKIIATNAGFIKFFKYLKLYLFELEASFIPRVQSINWSTIIHKDIKILPSLPYSAKIKGIPMKPAFEKVAIALYILAF